MQQCPDKILCWGEIKILKHKSINNVKKGNNALYGWKINNIWQLSLGCEYSVYIYIYKIYIHIFIFIYIYI